MRPRGAARIKGAATRASARTTCRRPRRALTLSPPLPCPLQTLQATTTQATVAATANAEIQERRAKEDLRAAAATYCAALQRLLRVGPPPLRHAAPRMRCRSQHGRGRSDALALPSHIIAYIFPTYLPAIVGFAQAQAKALVELHGANPQVESVMRQIWLALLPTTGILEPDYYRR